MNMINTGSHYIEANNDNVDAKTDHPPFYPRNSHYKSCLFPTPTNINSAFLSKMHANETHKYIYIKSAVSKRNAKFKQVVLGLTA